MHKEVLIPLGLPKRLTLVAAFIAAVIAIGWLTDADRILNVENVRTIVGRSGVWGYLIFIAVFTIGEMLHVFGLIFVAAGVYAFGRSTGLVLGLTGGVIAVSVSFLVMRFIGGKALSGIRHPWVVRVLDGLEKRPVRTVFILRLVLIMHPSLNYALALTNIRFLDYLVGSAAGLVIPISLFVIFFDRIIRFIQ